jgi:hypothetical protein
MFLKHFLSVMLTLSVSTFVFAQNCTGVERQLVGISLLMMQDDYEKTHDLKCESLRNGEYDTYTLNLQRGMTYKIIAVCDGDCRDLDAWLYDQNGNMPILTCTPRWSGSFKLKVKMYDCRINPCVFGIVVFGK